MVTLLSSVSVATLYVSPSPPPFDSPCTPSSAPASPFPEGGGEEASQFTLGSQGRHNSCASSFVFFQQLQSLSASTECLAVSKG